MKKVVIIGGDAAGMSAASKLRRAKPETQITVYEQTGETSYGTCGFPYFISGANDVADKMRIRRPNEFIKSGIDVKTFHKVTKVDSARKEVTVVNLETGAEKIDAYDKLVVASGAYPIMPPFFGRDLKGIYTLKTIQDAERICAHAVADGTKNVVIVGAGYIGLELAESFWKRKLSVRIIEEAAEPMRIMDREFTARICDTLKRHNVHLHLSEIVHGFQGDGHVNAVVTNKGEYPADLVVICVGARPCTAFLADTDVQLSSNGAVVVDHKMQTSNPDVYAAGDCALIRNKLTGKNVYLPFGTNANKQGKILGEILGGTDTYLEGVLGTSMCRIIDLELARTGLNMEDAQAAGIPCAFVITDASHTPPYYPETYCQVTVKLFYHPNTHVILGVQMAGEHGAATRIGACALAIDCKMTCEALALADMGYTPPFTYLWDPIQVAASMVKVQGCQTSSK